MERFKNKQNEIAFRKLLKPIELTILDKRIYGDTPRTLASISQQFNVSREWVRQIDGKLREALDKYVNEVDVVSICYRSSPGRKKKVEKEQEKEALKEQFSDVDEWVMYNKQMLQEKYGWEASVLFVEAIYTIDPDWFAIKPKHRSLLTCAAKAKQYNNINAWKAHEEKEFILAKKEGWLSSVFFISQMLQINPRWFQEEYTREEKPKVKKKKKKKKVRGKQKANLSLKDIQKAFATVFKNKR